MKKILINLFAVILAVSMVFTMAPLSMGKAYADDDPVTIKIEGVVYTVDEENGTAAVTGFDHDNPPTQVKIPEKVGDNQQYTVTSIGDFAFVLCESLTSITLPDSVKSIGEGVFTYCSAMESITLPNRLESIGRGAFRWCGLKSIIIPASVTSIGSSTFVGLSGLTSVKFAEGSEITTIPASFLDGCSGIKAFEIPASVTSIEQNAFNGCAGFTSIKLPEKVTSIGEYAFENCTGMTTITIPAGVTIIEQGAFDNVPLSTVNFLGSKSQWDAITGKGKPTGVTVIFAKEDPFKPISISGAGVALSAKSFTYNGKAQKPAIVKIGNWKMAERTDYTAAWSNASSKNVGTYSVTVTGKGKYKDTAKATYQIVPKGTTLKKPKKAKKAVTVKWKKQKAKMPKARISGYQIQLATNSAFTANTKTVNVKGYKKTSKKVKKLKGKTKYYVRVRTYMKSGGKTYYSPWSKVKTVKTK